MLTQVLIVVTLLAGTAFIMWMGELITQRGIGNGMSLIIFASIVARFPRRSSSPSRSEWCCTLIVLLRCSAWSAHRSMERAQRRIPVQYAKRVVGRRVYGGVGTYIPLKLNGANVIPIIFARSILYFPTVVGSFTNVSWMQQVRS